MLLDLLIGIAILGCLLRFVYRLNFEGKGQLFQPYYYTSIRRGLDLWAMIGSISAVPLLWWRVHWWAGLLWIAAYMATESRVSSIGDHRAINGFIANLRTGTPEATEEELQTRARDLLEFTKKSNAESGEYL